MKTDKRIEDYLHLYIGCDVMDLYNNKIGKLVGVSGKDVLISHNTQWCLAHKEVKPILRPLNSMTEEEAKFLIRLCYNMKDGDEYKIHDICDVHIAWTFPTISITMYGIFNKLNPTQFKYLLSIGMDLFSLIPSGLAIDKTTLK